MTRWINPPLVFQVLLPAAGWLVFCSNVDLQSPCAPVGSGWSAEQCLVLLLAFFHPAHRTQPGFQYRNTFCCYCIFWQFEWLALIDSICHSTRGTQIGTLEKNGKTRMHPSNYCSDSTGVQRCLQVSIFKHGGHG